MKNKIIIFYLLIVISIITWTGCSKEGPAGPSGNANVIASPWYTPAAWAGQTGDWYFDVSNSAITQDIVGGGAILAYVSLPGDLYSAAVRPLPAFAIGSNWDFLIPDYGQIEFTSDNLNMPGTTGYSFRFVLIPAGYALKSSSLKSAYVNQLKNMPYKDVCKTLGISE